MCHGKRSVQNGYAPDPARCPYGNARYKRCGCSGQATPQTRSGCSRSVKSGNTTDWKNANRTTDWRSGQNCLMGRNDNWRSAAKKSGCHCRKRSGCCLAKRNGCRYMRTKSGCRYKRMWNGCCYSHRYCGRCCCCGCHHRRGFRRHRAERKPDPPLRRVPKIQG